jgi:3D (Asp-Asp-Asp) domain-containing protein
MKYGPQSSSILSYLARLVARIVRGIKELAPAALVLGCQGPKVEKQIEKAPAAVVAPAPAPEDDEPKPLGTFDITFYYVVGEDDVKPKLPAVAVANDNAPGDTSLAAIAPSERVTLYEPKACKPIADVTPEFESQLILQGTGKLRDGRVVNIWGACGCPNKPCFKVTPNQWGTGGSGKPLEPFRTVAVDRKVVKLGTLLYIPVLEGQTMPGRPPYGGYVHDGCVVANDTGGGIDGHQLDLFVGRKSYYAAMSWRGGSHRWARKVPVFDGSKICQHKGRHVSRKSGAI